MNWPVPHPGLVIRYEYLWASEAHAGREEGVKDRPCAIILVILRKGEHPIVRVLPITHTPPSNPADAIKLPQPTKQRLGLDADRSWVVLSEANDFIWPGPDLRPLPGRSVESIVYGVLPPGFMRILRTRLEQRRRERQFQAVGRTEQIARRRFLRPRHAPRAHLQRPGSTTTIPS